MSERDWQGTDEAADDGNFFLRWLCGAFSGVPYL